MPVLRAVHAILALLAAAFVALVVVANLGCAPKYFQRGDVIGLLALAVEYAVLLGWASLGDSDVHRAVGAASSAGLVAVFVSTASIPVVAAPLAIAGALRLPRARRPRMLLFVAYPVLIIATIAVPYLGQLGLTPDQFRC